MSEPDRPGRNSPSASPLAREETLGSWKAIANYMGRTVRTVQRWEKTEELPVRRLQHEGGSSVYAYKRDLDQWLRSRNLLVPEQNGEDRTTASAATAGAESGGAAAETESAPPARRFSLRSVPPYGWIITAAAILALGVLPWVIAGRQPPEKPTPDAVIARVLTTDPGVERFPSLSPDGRQVVYVWENEAGEVDLYLRLVEVAEAIRLTRDPGVEESPEWSPDGLSIAFFRSGEAGQRHLMVMPALGGPEREIATVQVPLEMEGARAVAASLSWFPDGRWISFNQDGGAPETSDIIALSLESGERVPLTDAPDGFLDLAPAISPDGRFVAFTRSVSAHNGQLHVAPIELHSSRASPPAATPLPSATPWDTDPIWTTDGHELIFSGGRWPKTRLWRMTADGKGEPFPVAGTGMGGGSPSIALAQVPGRNRAVWRMVYSAVELDNDIWTVSLTDGEARLFQGSSQRERFPSFRPADPLITFLSDRSGFREIWAAELSTDTPVQWTDWQSSYVWRPAWSPDGALLAYTVEIDGKLKAYVQNRPLGGFRMLTPDESEDEDLAWSPDGRHLYTTSPDRNPLGQAIYSLPLDGSAPEFIALSNGRPLGEHPRQHALLIQVTDSGNEHLDMLDRDTGTARRIELGPARRHSFTAAPDGIYFIAVTEFGAEIRRWGYDDAVETVVVALDREPEYGMSVDPSGQTAALAFINVLRGDLMLAEGLR